MPCLAALVLTFFPFSRYKRKFVAVAFARSPRWKSPRRRSRLINREAEEKAGGKHITFLAFHALAASDIAGCSSRATIVPGKRAILKRDPRRQRTSRQTSSKRFRRGIVAGEFFSFHRRAYENVMIHCRGEGVRGGQGSCAIPDGRGGAKGGRNGRARRMRKRVQ